MTQKYFQIITRGETESKSDTETVKKNLAELFKTEPAKIRPFFSGKPFCIKGGLERTAAEKYQRAISKAGLKCLIVPQDKSESPSDAAPQKGKTARKTGPDTPPPPEKQSESRKDCPKCRGKILFSGIPPDECPHCGVIIQKYIDSQNRRDTLQQELRQKKAKKKKWAAYAVLAAGIFFIAFGVWNHYVRSDAEKQLSAMISMFNVSLQMHKSVSSLKKQGLFITQMYEKTAPDPKKLQKLIDDLTVQMKAAEKKRKWIKWISLIIGGGFVTGFFYLKNRNEADEPDSL